MTATGIGLPNDHLRAGELAEILALGCCDYLIYLADPADVAYWADVARQIRAAQPNARIHLRIEQRGALGDPVSEAHALLTIVCTYRSSNVDLASVRWRNEPNIESPGVTPAIWQGWLTTFLQAVRGMVPPIPIHAPAISPGTADWWDWLQATATAAIDGGAVGLDVHAYGWASEISPILAAARKVWSGLILVSETNFGPGRAIDLGAYAAAMPDVWAIFGQSDVEAACWFLWRWETPDVGMPTSVNVPNTPIEQALKELNVPTASTPEFRLGFKTLADQLGEAVVGTPVENEHYWPDGTISVQTTTTGVMWYSKTGNQAKFLPFAKSS